MWRCLAVLALLILCQGCVLKSQLICPSIPEPRKLSAVEQRRILAFTDSLARHYVNVRTSYHFEDYLSRFPVPERGQVIERLRADGYPVATDSAYWAGFDRAIRDVRGGTFRYELVENIGGFPGGPMVSELRDVVLAERYGVIGDEVVGHVCIQPSGRPVCVVQQANRAGYNHVMDATVGRYFGTNDLIRTATEEGLDRYGTCHVNDHEYPESEN